MWRGCGTVAAVLVLLTFGRPAISGAQSSQAKADTYTWVAELVSVDASAMKMNVKPRVAYPEAMAELKQFKPGDSVVVLWSGVHDYSDAVRQVRRAETNHKIDENLMLPAEFIAAGTPDSSVTIRVKVPQSSLSAIKALKPGEWVTVTSRQRPATEAESVVAVRKYGSTTSTN